jgi:diguanylate cyclase (GGDEF)-like protein
VSVLVLNFDHFKTINDEHGHAAGDAALQVLAKIVRRELRPEDVFARVENQDFAILLRGTREKEALACAGRVRVAISKEPLPSAKNGTVTVSIGVATSDEAPENLLELATSRLRKAKSTGRDQVRSA